MDDLKVCVLRLLKFVEDSVNEALKDLSSRPGLLSEADEAIRQLERIVAREDSVLLTKLRLLGVFDQTLEDSANSNPLNPSEQIKEALQVKMGARILFNV
jgi:hypothetical protein